MICPRCDDQRAAKIFDSPESGAWEIFRCPRCFFTWRSTEEDRVTRPELYDADFKLSEAKIREMIPKPPIVPPEGAASKPRY